MPNSQLDLFDGVLAAYKQSATMSNADLYASLSETCGISMSAWNERVPIGKSGELHSLLKRKVRWIQQSLKSLDLLESYEGKRGVWQLTPKGKSKLTAADTGRVLLGFSTNLGFAIWGRAEDVFPHLGESIDLCFTSLPYPLIRPRDYGNPDEHEFVDWACRLLEPIVAQLAASGSMVINLGNDVFEKGTPARSMYKERLLLAMSDRFGLHCMDTLIWNNPSRPPGPLQWASLSRQQLNAKYETMYWLSPDPLKCKADNRRVLLPHTEEHLKLIQKGGESRTTSYGDGAHRVKPGSYSNPTAGRIPGNVLTQGHRCADKAELAKLAKAAGLPLHGATMPLKLAQFAIEFLTEKNDLVVDPCAGWNRTAKAAQQLERRFITTEQMGEYVLGGALGMKEFPDFKLYGNFVK